MIYTAHNTLVSENARTVYTLPSSLDPTRHVLIQMTGRLFIQGDCGGDRPGMLDPVGQIKHDAWLSFKVD